MRLDIANDDARIGHVDVDHGAIAGREGGSRLPKEARMDGRPRSCCIVAGGSACSCDEQTSHNTQLFPNSYDTGS